MKIAEAKLVPYSSIVGRSIMLLDSNGRSVGQLAVLGAGDDTDAIAQEVAAAINSRDDLDRHKAVTENLHRLSTSNKIK